MQFIIGTWNCIRLAVLLEGREQLLIKNGRQCGKCVSLAALRALGGVSKTGEAHQRHVNGLRCLYNGDEREAFWPCDMTRHGTFNQHTRHT